AIASQVPMPGFCAGIQVSLKRRLIALPALSNGPRILDFTGRQLATWSDGHEPVSRRFWHAAIRPSDAAVVLAEYDGGLWLWDWEHDKLTALAEDASAPSVA